MNERIHEFRLSVIWIETLLDLLEGAASQAPASFLGNRFAYSPQFDAPSSGAGGRLSLERPWPVTQGKSFWGFYYEDERPLETIGGKQAWQGVTPFRRRLGQLQPDWQDARLVREGFLFPHGLAFVVTLTQRGDFDLTQTGDAALEFRRKPKSYSDPHGTTSIRLDDMAAKALSELRAAAFGPTAKVGRQPSEPFTVFTVIRGSNVDPTVPVADGGDIHRLLDGVTGWSPAWASANPPALAKQQLPVRKGAAAGDVLYGRSRGRAVWFPGSFTRPGGEIRSLSCYHRNLALASLQVESLGGLARETARKLREGEDWSKEDDLKIVARNAVNTLGRLYGGRSTYRSWSLRAQMEQNGLVPDINATRADLNIEPLFAPP
jgi:hypothetical protein